MTELVPNNTTTNPLLGSAVYFGSWVNVNDVDFGAVQVVVTADQVGTIVVQYATIASANNIIYSDEKPVDIDTPTILVSSVKAPFFRVKYENGTETQTSFSLTTTLAKTFSGDVSVSVVLDPTTSGVAVFGQKPDSSLSEFQLDADGNLKTTATLSVEGTLSVHDASAVELLEQIADGIVVQVGEVDISGASFTGEKLNVFDASAVAQMTIETDRILYDTDIIANHLADICGNTDLMLTQLEDINGYLDAGLSVSVSNFPETQAVSGSVSVSSLPEISGSVSISNFPATQLVKDISAVGFLEQIADGIVVQVDGAVEVSGNVYNAGRLQVIDASSLEQLEDIASAMAGTLSVEVVNSDEIAVHDASAIEQLELVNFNLEDIGDRYLYAPPTQHAQVDFDTYSASLAQGSTWSVPADGQDGWSYVKTSSGGATLYTYSNSTLTPLAQEDNMTLGSVASMFFVANYPIVYDDSNDRQFYLGIYTKPTGVNDYQPWYHSRKVYTLRPETIVSKGGDRFYYAGIDISTIYKDLEHVEYVLAYQNGDCSDNEIVQFISLNVDSAVPVGQFSGIVKMAGYSSGGNTLKVAEFGNYSRELTATNNLNSLVVSAGELAVHDASAVELLEQIADGIVVSVGEVDISGVSVVDEKLSVFDASCASLLEEIKDNGITAQVTFPSVQVVEISGVPVVEISGSVVADVTFPSVQVVEISGVPVVEISGSVVADVTFPATQVVEVSGVPVVEISGSVVADVTFPATQVVEVSGVPVVEISGSVVADVTFPATQVVDVSGSVDVSGLSFTEQKLNVFDASCASHLSVVEEILENGFVNVYDASSELVLEGIKAQTDRLAFQDEGTYETLRVHVENPSSGGGVVEISGVTLVDGKLPVFDASANVPLSQMSFFADGYGAYDLRTQVTNQVGVSVNNQPTVSLASGTEVGLVTGTQVTIASGSAVAVTGSVEVVNSVGGSLSVTESNPISGFALETTLQDVYDRLHDISGSVAIAGSISVADLSVNVLNSSLDTHIYGRHNSTWTAVNVAANGHLNVNSSTQDGAGTAITSTTVTGTESYTALDVKCRGTTTVSGGVNALVGTDSGNLTSTLEDEVNALDVSVKNVLTTNLRTSANGLLTSTFSAPTNSLDVAIQNTPSVKAVQYGSYGNLALNVASILPAGSTAGINVADWSYIVGYYEDYYSGTFPSGQLRLQYSFDNITYYNIFGTGIYPGGTVTITLLGASLS
jgi:hypothetical protein